MKPICFVLGAGASAPNDFPLGTELVTEILDLDANKSPWTDFNNQQKLRELQGALRSARMSWQLLLLPCQCSSQKTDPAALQNLPYFRSSFCRSAQFRV
jgi:hypothetical protein